MPYVNVSEVGTFQSALDVCGYHKNINIPYLTSLTKREMNDGGCMVPTETLGRLWNATSSILPVEYALQVAEAHTETTKVYGQWGEVMDVAVDIGDRLNTGISLMPAHTDDPKWELEDGDGVFHLTRNWRYANTSLRAEAFASVSEFREWLIVMQRHVRQPIQPQGIELTHRLYKALGPDDVHHIARFFGCDVCPSDRNSIAFLSRVLDYHSGNGDPERLVAIRSRLMEGLPHDAVRFERQSSGLLALTRISHKVSTASADKPMTTASRSKKVLDVATATPPRFFLRAPCIHGLLRRLATTPCEKCGLKKRTYAGEGPDVSAFLSAIDLRHRESLSLAAKDAAEYVAELGGRSSELNGIDIGGGYLEVTEVFLRRLASRTAARVRLSVVDPILSVVHHHVRERKGRIERELGAEIELKGLRWLDHVKGLPAGKAFDFAVCFQLLSLLPSDEIERTFVSLHEYLKTGGRFFAAFEPYDRVTLAKYDGLDFYQRPVEWYRETARRAGFVPNATTVHTAHEDNPSSALVCLRFVNG